MSIKIIYYVHFAGSNMRPRIIFSYHARWLGKLGRHATWLSSDFVTVDSNNLKGHCWQHMDLGRSMSESQAWRVIWNAVIFSIWKFQNAFIFKQARPDNAVLIQEVKFLVWSWLHSSAKWFKSSFVQWYYDPAASLYGGVA